MSFLNVLLGREKHNDNDWIHPDWEAWIHIGSEAGLEYYVDRNSCYKERRFYWWKLKIHSPGEYQEFLICLGAMDKPSILVPVKQMMSDPDLKPIKDQTYKQMMSYHTNPILLKCIDWVVENTLILGPPSPPPYVTYASLLMSKWRSHS